MALIEGDEGDNTLEGVADENNEIRGFGGDDTLTGANLADTILGGEGDDTIRGGAGGDLLASGPGSNTIFGEAGPDIIDLTEGLEGDTNLPSGGDDTDAFYAGAGSDIIDGGDGSDLVSYEFAAEGVVVLLGDGITDFGAAGDVLTTVEMLFGSDFDDILAGDDGENTINGGAGNDLIAGYGGFDFLDGGDGRDLIAFVQGAVRVDLAAGTASGADADGVTYTGFEGVYASPFDDRVSGDDGRNTLLGQEGDDKLHGRDGNDEIIGGIGDDSLLGGDGRDSLSGEDGDDRMLGGAGRDRQTGGGGADRFEFRALSDSGRPVAERDTIVDFSRKDGDSILLSRIDANDGRRGDQAFDFIGQDRFGGEDGELRYKKAGDHLTLLGDVDGDGRADLAVDVYGVGRMLAGDFVL